MRSFRHFRPALLLAAFAAASMHAGAQQFQFAYGGTQNDGARGDVVTAENGDFVSVGETRSIPVGTLSTNVYVVRTDACGNLVWARAYDLGGNDYGRRIQRTPDNGYVIVGTTQNSSGCVNNDIFLMKIASNGNLVWARTYGGTDVDEGWDVRVVSPTDVNTGFVIAAGTKSFNVGSYGVSTDGYIIRTASDGYPVWARVLGTKYCDYFRTCIVAANGDIIAAGATQNPSGVRNDTNVFVVRLNSSGQTLWANHYGITDQDEDAWRMVELPVQENNDIVLVGHTTAAGNSADGLAMVISSAGTFLRARAYGTGGWDEFRDIELDPNYSPLMIVAGYVPNIVFGYDVYVGEILPLLQFGPAIEYGGTLDDFGWGLELVDEGDHTESVVAGVTRSFGFGGEDLYLLKGDQRTDTGCNDRLPDVIRTYLTFTRTAMSLCESNILVFCKNSPVSYTNTNQQRVCQDCPIIPQNAPGKDPAGLSLNDPRAARPAVDAAARSRSRIEK